MKPLDLFEVFNTNGKLAHPQGTIEFNEIPWCKHPTFEGVELKHIVTSQQTDHAFSYHLVRIQPHKKIGYHTHETQLETHEVIAGSGTCHHSGSKIHYIPGTIAILAKQVEHEVIAGDEGLYLFAKFIPALC